MKKTILLLTLLLSMSVMLTSCKDSKTEAKSEQTENGVEKADLALNDVYQCPMDCEQGKTYDKEGTCPVCKMNLQKIDNDEAHENEHDENGEQEDND